ncbi:unnamed protein product [Prunus armeniaca]
MHPSPLVARKRKNQNRASNITHPQSSRPSLDQHDDPIEPSHDNEMEDMPLETEPSNEEGSTVGIKKGRGKAKGKDGNGTPIVIRRGRYTHCPLGISQDVWSKLVDHWLQPTWQDKSKRNKSNRVKSTIVHTTVFVPMEKYRKDELDRTGIEPSPIDCFKKFHVSKPKNGGEESWPNEKAKELFEKMKNKNVVATEDENEVDDWDIYKEVIGGPSHGRILGLECEEEHEKLKEEVKDLKSVLYELKDLVQSMRENNSNTYARSRQSALMDNVESCSDAHLEDE